MSRNRIKTKCDLCGNRSIVCEATRATGKTANCILFTIPWMRNVKTSN